MGRSWFRDPRDDAGPAPAGGLAAAVAADAAWRRQVKRRVVVVLVLLGAWAVVIQARLGVVQVLHATYYTERARQQQEGWIDILATRGDILDRHGDALAYSVAGHALEADPSLIEDPELALRQLCEALTDCSTAERREWRERLARVGRWVRLRSSRRVSPEQAGRLADLEQPWLILRSESRRYYPGRDLAAHVLGYVGDDNGGLGGVESRFDDVVGGEMGKMLVRRDAHFNRLMTEVLQAATTGATLELTLDRTLQYIAERELRAGVAEANAVAGTVIILDPFTGEVLAMASSPTFNPNDYQASPGETWRNRAVQDVYEPGSTFKIVTASAALEERVFRPTTIIDINHGVLRVPGRRIPIIDEHPSGTLLTFEDVIVKSSNVGAAKVGMTIGAERLSLFAKRLGFGQTLAPDFAGESRGIVHPPSSLTLAALSTVAMGYTIGVTPLQMVSAMAAIANGGLLMEPHVVRAVVRDGVREPVEPKVLRRAIQPETAATLMSFLENVVSRGTARAARLARHQAAGKTGTAKKAIPGGYSQTDRVSSFVGVVPSRDPRFAVLVLIDTPRNGQVYGGAIAAPVFKRIAEAAVRLYGVAPTVDPEPPYVVPPDRSAIAVTAAHVDTAPPATVRLGGRTLMPDLRGLSARDAIAALHEIGLRVRLAGSGSVHAQTPAAGEPVEPGEWGALQLRRTATRPRDEAGGR